ncbi:hypothetical protein QBC39DRAFT_358806 [Podospora conica]|nr:hypothetical protein QBC39DRAFT_358806 [Schizothecium conicum]
MCPTNSPTLICGASVNFYRQRPDTIVRFCIKTKATILYTISREAMTRLSASAAASRWTQPVVVYRAFLARLRRICYLDHGYAFTAIVHRHFDNLVRDYLVRQGRKMGLWVSWSRGSTWALTHKSQILSARLPVPSESRLKAQPARLDPGLVCNTHLLGRR